MPPDNDDKQPSTDIAIGFDEGREPSRSVLSITDAQGRLIHNLPLKSVSITTTREDLGKDLRSSIKGKAQWSAKAEYLLPGDVNDNRILARLIGDPRSCGGCTACCKVLAVPTIEKPIDSWCDYCEIRNGCKIHDFKPPECTEFECMWSRGMIAPGWARPDRLRTMFDVTVTRWGPMARGWEVSAGGLAKPETRAVVSELAKVGLLATRTVGGKWSVYFDRLAREKQWTMRETRDAIRDFEAAVADGTVWDPPSMVQAP